MYLFYYICITMWFTPEAQQILNEQEQFLEKKYEQYQKIKEKETFSRDAILTLFQENQPELHDQPMIVRRGEWDESLVIETVRWYWYAESIQDFEFMLIQALWRNKLK